MTTKCDYKKKSTTGKCIKIQHHKMQGVTSGFMQSNCNPFQRDLLPLLPYLFLLFVQNISQYNFHWPRLHKILLRKKPEHYHFV